MLFSRTASGGEWCRCNADGAPEHRTRRRGVHAARQRQGRGLRAVAPGQPSLSVVPSGRRPRGDLAFLRHCLGTRKGPKGKVLTAGCAGLRTTAMRGGVSRWPRPCSPDGAQRNPGRFSRPRCTAGSRTPLRCVRATSLRWPRGGGRRKPCARVCSAWPTLAFRRPERPQAAWGPCLLFRHCLGTRKGPKGKVLTAGCAGLRTTAVRGGGSRSAALVSGRRRIEDALHASARSALAQTKKAARAWMPARPWRPDRARAD